MTYPHPLVVALTAAGRSQPTIAAEVGVSVRTVRRMLRHPLTAELVAGARLRMEEEALGRLTELRARACATLDTLLDHPEPAVALKTISLILSATHSQRTAVHQSRIQHDELVLRRREHALDVDGFDEEDPDDDETDQVIDTGRDEDVNHGDEDDEDDEVDEVDDEGGQTS